MHGVTVAQAGSLYHKDVAKEYCYSDREAASVALTVSIEYSQAYCLKAEINTE